MFILETMPVDQRFRRDRIRFILFSLLFAAAFSFGIFAQLLFPASLPEIGGVKPYLDLFFLCSLPPMAIFLCGFTAFSPLFSALTIALQAAVTGYDLSLFYRVLNTGDLFSGHRGLWFFALFMLRCMGGMLLLLQATEAAHFSSMLRNGLPLRRLCRSQNLAEYIVTFALFTLLCALLTALYRPLLLMLFPPSI